MRTEGNAGQSFNSVGSSMQRDRVGDRTDAPGGAQDAGSIGRGAQAGRKPNKQEIRDFKALMQRGAKQEKSADTRQVQSRGALEPYIASPGDAIAPQEHGDSYGQDSGLQQHVPGWLPHVDGAQAQQMPAQAFGAPPPAAAPPAPAPALAELIERHVRQMLVSETATSARGGDVLLRMSDAALPGTDIWLRRTERGWKVRADVRSRDSYDAIVAGSERLVKRFAEHGLGELDIESVYREG
jgi:hypothetical protein